ncbi:MAG: glycosyltransferase [Cyanobacteria bacterium J06649_4]
MPLAVSIVIPTYNCQRYIAEAIWSALSQKQTSEVIVIDDGSSDGTADIVRQIENRIENTQTKLSTPVQLRYVHQQNQGVSAARNHGIQLAKESLVAFLDADDYFLPGKIERQVAVIEQSPGVGLVQSGWQKVDDTGKAIAPVTPWQNVPKLNLENWLHHKPVLPSALMVKRDWLLKVGGFDTQLKAAEDVDLVSRLALAGCQSAWLEQVAVCYRQRANSAMGDGKVQAEDLAKFLQKFFQQHDLPESVQLLEQSVRYHTMVWAAWYLQHTGYLAEMAQYLRKAWTYSPYLPIEALVHWVDSFSKFSEDAAKPLDMSALMQSEDWQALVTWLMQQN